MNKRDNEDVILCSGHGERKERTFETSETRLNAQSFLRPFLISLVRD